MDERSGLYQPLLPVKFGATGISLKALALLDTGAPFSVLPREIGERLGLNWNSAKTFVKLGGGLEGVQTKAVLLTMAAARFEATEIAFAWAENDSPRLILGQVNFFEQFRICFFRKDLAFSICPEKVQTVS